MAAYACLRLGNSRCKQAGIAQSMRAAKGLYKLVMQLNDVTGVKENKHKRLVVGQFLQKFCILFNNHLSGLLYVNVLGRLFLFLQSQPRLVRHAG